VNCNRDPRASLGGPMGALRRPRILLVPLYGYTAHVLRNFRPRLVAVMRCGRAFPQWREADNGSEVCKRCSPNSEMSSGSKTT
jgi:hypothetical protein